MAFTRRDTSKLLLASAALAGSLSPAAAFFHKKPDWPTKLQKDLNKHVIPGCNGTLTLTGFGIQSGQKVKMETVIQLNWPPGTRTRKFTAIGADAEATYNALLNQALFDFAKSWPGCVV